MSSYISASDAIYHSQDGSTIDFVGFVFPYSSKKEILGMQMDIDLYEDTNLTGEISSAAYVYYGNLSNLQNQDSTLWKSSRCERFALLNDNSHTRIKGSVPIDDTPYSFGPISVIYSSAGTGEWWVVVLTGPGWYSMKTPFPIANRGDSDSVVGLLIDD